MKKYVVSLDLSIKLHEAGFPQTTEFSWWETVDYDDTPRLNWTDENREGYLPTQSFEKKHAAPLSDEILDQLPIPIKAGANYRPFIGRDIQTYELQLVNETNIIDYKVFKGKSLANAAAKMWLYLKNEGLI